MSYLYDADECAAMGSVIARPAVFERDDLEAVEFRRMCSIPAPIKLQPLMPEFRVQGELFETPMPRAANLGNRASWILGARLRLELATVAASVARGRHRYHAQNMADSARRELRQLGAPEETYANV